MLLFTTRKLSNKLIFYTISNLGAAASSKKSKFFDYKVQSAGRLTQFDTENASCMTVLPEMESNSKCEEINDGNPRNALRSKKQNKTKNTIRHADKEDIPEFERRSMCEEKDKSEKSRNAVHSKKENKPKNSIRYDGKAHLPGFDTNTYATRCKNENCHFKTNVICSKCGIHLCFTRNRNCFKDFHILEQNESE